MYYSENHKCVFEDLEHFLRIVKDFGSYLDCKNIDLYDESGEAVIDYGFMANEVLSQCRMAYFSNAKRLISQRNYPADRLMDLVANDWHGLAVHYRGKAPFPDDVLEKLLKLKDNIITKDLLDAGRLTMQQAIDGIEYKSQSHAELVCLILETLNAPLEFIEKHWRHAMEFSVRKGVSMEVLIYLYNRLLKIENPMALIQVFRYKRFLRLEGFPIEFKKVLLSLYIKSAINKGRGPDWQVLDHCIEIGVVTFKELWNMGNLIFRQNMLSYFTLTSNGQEYPLLKCISKFINAQSDEVCNEWIYTDNKDYNPDKRDIFLNTIGEI